ncbi:pentapeptide repeat-containing protein [Streptomyces sp. MB09-01]|uniref:pentapeptide repeat-containing protein n=1 Tax=Streptomyces sp. MB09-01 TaxID=3028666 RepID=UPI0029AEAEFA|nr:pentapeptide repeat-containing protein [Streptomyces sp. MB09-01]MDX3538888.1 pentapeptide repeat-containing protein [Streptomyces sp. MB09-01]
MIERLLAAFAEGADDDGGPRTGVGAEEIADILWLAARVDPAGARTPAAPAADPAGEQPPVPGPPAPEPGPGTPSSPVPGGRDGGGPAVRFFPASPREPAGDPADVHGKPADAAPGRRGSPVRLPRAASLDDPLALMRSLRPVGRRSIGGPGEELDEQLTVERSIERRVATPVLRPAESRWLDLALVVDTHHSMLLWSDLVDELRRVLTRSGVFRDVRTWQLTGTGSGATPMVTRGRGGPPRNPLELADPAGRRLILVLSDTVAGGWREAPVQGVLRHWCAHNAVAVLNVLPERLWTRGAVRPVPFAVRADRPAAATRSWQQVPAARRAGAGRRRAAAAAVVPVVGVASGSLARLVRVVSGDGRWRRLACLRLDAEPGTTGAPEDPAPAAGRSALEVVERFRASASPTAQQLAAHLAAVPLTLPVMTLVRRSLLRDSEHGHLAEVALGGLFAPWGAEQDAEEVEFEFLPGVREALLGSQLRGDVAAVRELVRRRVWEFMSRNRGTGPDFSAVRVAPGRAGRRRVADGALPFAAGPPRDQGLRDRVVRVRYDAMPEPQEVGTLLTPRLVLTVGDAPLSRGAVAWVRAGAREVPCRPVWWDDALPRVFLLEADEDLVAPGAWPEPMPPVWTQDPPADRVRVDGVTDQGDPVALTAEVVPYEGARNGELVRLSAEPESWTHYRGGPVSDAGKLVGVVHGVWPDRMVFLSGRALHEQPGFRETVEEAVWSWHDALVRPAAGLPVCVAVQPGDDGVYPRGSSPNAEVSELLMRLMGDTRITGRLTGGEEGDPVLVVLETPGALGKAGRLLSELPGAMAGFGDRRTDGAHPSLAVSVATGETPAGETPAGGSPVPGRATADAVHLLRHPGIGERDLRRSGFGSLVLALSHPLYLELREVTQPDVLRSLDRSEGGPAGWMWTGDPAELGAALLEAAELRSEGVGWPTCGVGATESEPVGCLGIRLPGHDRCLAHLESAEQRAYLGTLGPGAPLDLRGTTFERGLLQEVLEAVRHPGSRRVRLGPADFDRARFVDDWNTVDAEFSGRASFAQAVFAGRAMFVRTAVGGRASFTGAVFHGVAVFDRSLFQRASTFRRTVFRGPAEFTDTEFLEGVSFGRAALEAPADLNGMRVTGTADFTRTVFSGPAGLSGADFAGPVCFASARWERGLVAGGAVFHGPVDFGRAAFHGRVRFEGVRFAADADAVPPFTDRPEDWAVRRRTDGTWDVRLLDAGEK